MSFSEKIKSVISRNKKVAENYFFMIALQIISSAFGLIIYPYLIRVMGSESYGLYVFAVSVTMYFVTFISFGFNLPGLKYISLNKTDSETKSKVLSEITSAKFYLGVVSTIIFVILLNKVPFLKANQLVFGFAYIRVLSEIIFPLWYFQGIQKMKIVTYIQLAMRILSVPFIFILVKSPDDCHVYSLINSVTFVSAAILLFTYLIRTEGIRFRLVSPIKTYVFFKEAMPFFWTSIIDTLKSESVTLIIGSFFGMSQVALYDLANKLVSIPNMLTKSINPALFPKMIENPQSSIVKKILKYQIFIGLAVMVFIAVFGYWIILVLGGSQMTGAYPISLILSFTIIAWLISESYINYVFVPHQKYYYVTLNQIIALTAFLALCLPFVFIFSDIRMVALSLSFSGLCEIIFCYLIVKKKKML